MHLHHTGEGKFVHKNRGPREPRHSEFWAGKRKKFVLANLMAVVMLQVLFLANLSNFYGSSFHVNRNVHHFKVLLVDYDDGVVSQALQAAYRRMRDNGFPTLEPVNAADYPTEQSLINEVCQNRHIYALLYTHAGASNRLSAAIGGGSGAAAYNASNAISFIWNGVRYNTFGQSLVAANLQQLITASGVAYASLNNSYAYSSVNTSSPQAITALAQPFRPSSIDIMPTTQGSRTFYNSVTIVMTIISQFFFCLSINGIAGSFGMFTRLTITRNLYVRWGSAILYSACLASILTGVIWAFRESWHVTASQGVETWLMFTFICNIHFLILDFAAGFIPMRYVPFFVLTWVLLNVTSTITPLELTPGFYHWQYALPSFEAYQLLVTIWSHGCVPQMFRALPILFTWWIIGLLGSWVSMIQKCNAATHIERAEEEHVAEQAQEMAAGEESEKTLRNDSTPDSGADVPDQSSQNKLAQTRTLNRPYGSYRGGDSSGALWMSTPLPFQDRLGLTPARTAPAGNVERRPETNMRGASGNGVDA